MKCFFIFFLMVVTACKNEDPKIDGAYALVAAKYGDSSVSKEDLAKRRTIKIFKSGYWIATTFGNGGFFERGSGGTYVVKDGKCIETVNFSSWDSTAVNNTSSFDYKTTGNKYFSNGMVNGGRYKNHTVSEEYDRINKNIPIKDSSIEGVWQRQSFYWDDSPEPANDDLRHIKIYSFPCFAWAQYHVKQKHFLAAGGGTYEFDGDNLIAHFEYLTPWPMGREPAELSVTRISPNEMKEVSINGLMKETWKKIK